MIIPASLALRAPGLCGRLVRYIEDSAIYSQPQLSLAAALSMLAALKAHRIRSESNLRTNILCVGLAGSGSGKGHGHKTVAKLLNAIEHGYLVVGKPASDMGLLKALSRSGRALVQWDEFGLALKHMTSLRAPAYKAAILSVLMDTFSAADSLYVGQEYSNSDNKRPRIDISEPCLSLYGISTPVRFFEAFSSDFILDGFLPRLFIFEGGNAQKVGYRQYERGKEADSGLLVEELREAFPAFPLSSLPTKKPCRVLSFDQSAIVTFSVVVDQYETLKVNAESEAIRAIYSRAIEHFIKLCLVVEDPSRTAISHEVAVFCADILEVLIATSVDAVGQQIFDNQVSRDNHRLTEIVRKAKVISRRDLTRQTRFLKSFERKQIIEDLIDADIIESFFDTTGAERKKRTQFYRIRT